MGVHDFKYNKVPSFARKTVAAPKLALVPASRYYCDVNWPYYHVCAKFH